MGSITSVEARRVLRYLRAGVRGNLPLTVTHCRSHRGPSDSRSCPPPPPPPPPPPLRNAVCTFLMGLFATRHGTPVGIPYEFSTTQWKWVVPVRKYSPSASPSNARMSSETSASDHKAPRISARNFVRTASEQTFGAMKASGDFGPLAPEWVAERLLGNNGFRIHGNAR